MKILKAGQTFKFGYGKAPRTVEERCRENWSYHFICTDCSEFSQDLESLWEDHPHSMHHLVRWCSGHGPEDATLDVASLDNQKLNKLFN